MFAFSKGIVLHNHFLNVYRFMMTSSNGNNFRVTGHLCGEFTGLRWIPHTMASDAELWCFYDLRLNKQLSKQPWGWWFETPSRPLWRHRYVSSYLPHHIFVGIIIITTTHFNSRLAFRVYIVGYIAYVIYRFQIYLITFLKHIIRIIWIYIWGQNDMIIEEYIPSNL